MNRYKQITPRVIGKAKAKATFCLDLVALDQLNEIYINRMRMRQKADRSSLMCEAISLLFEKESQQKNIEPQAYNKETEEDLIQSLF